MVGINSMEKTLVLGECKWSPQVTGRKVLFKLIAKTPEIIPKRGSWKVYYLGFARGGWTNAAHAFAGKMSQAVAKGENWEAAGMELLDLDQVDRDMAAWSV